MVYYSVSLLELSLVAVLAHIRDLDIYIFFLLCSCALGENTSNLSLVAFSVLLLISVLILSAIYFTPKWLFIVFVLKNCRTNYKTICYR